MDSDEGYNYEFDEDEECSEEDSGAEEEEDEDDDEPGAKLVPSFPRHPAAVGVPGQVVAHSFWTVLCFPQENALSHLVPLMCT